MMAIKLLFAPDTGKLLGAQVVGAQGVDKRIDVLAATLRFGGTVADLQALELAYAPPFSSAKDPVNIAGFAASNIVGGLVATISAYEVPERLGSAIFVDVRNPAEHGIGAIEGSLNIPLPQLRHRITEVPKDKPLVVYCQVGHQAYVACRLLTQLGYHDVVNLSGGWRTYSAIVADLNAKAEPGNVAPETTNQETAAARLEDEHLMPTVTATNTKTDHRILDVTGLACPGPIAQVHQVFQAMEPGSNLEVHASDPGFATDIQAWCSRTGNTLLSCNTNGTRIVAILSKGKTAPGTRRAAISDIPHDKTFVVFSGDLDKALAAFVMATGAAAMDRKVTMFFTFWGLNILRSQIKPAVKKSFVDRMFGLMMPRGSGRLSLSRMNMGGIGPKLIRSVMGNKGITSLEGLMEQAMRSGVRIVACQMSMDVMGIKKEELIPGVEVGGVATYLAAAETADTNLFI